MLVPDPATQSGLVWGLGGLDLGLGLDNTPSQGSRIEYFIKGSAREEDIAIAMSQFSQFTYCLLAFSIINDFAKIWQET